MFMCLRLRVLMVSCLLTASYRTRGESYAVIIHSQTPIHTFLRWFPLYFSKTNKQMSIKHTLTHTPTTHICKHTHKKCAHATWLRFSVCIKQFAQNETMKITLTHLIYTTPHMHIWMMNKTTALRFAGHAQLLRQTRAHRTQAPGT